MEVTPMLQQNWLMSTHPRRVSDAWSPEPKHRGASHRAGGLCCFWGLGGSAGAAAAASFHTEQARLARLHTLTVTEPSKE